MLNIITYNSRFVVYSKHLADLLPADEHPEQRGLARAVGADHSDDPAAGQRERQVLDEQPIAVALRQVLGLDHLVTQAGSGRDGDL